MVRYKLSCETKRSNIHCCVFNLPMTSAESDKNYFWFSWSHLHGRGQFCSWVPALWKDQTKVHLPSPVSQNSPYRCLFQTVTQNCSFHKLLKNRWNLSLLELSLAICQFFALLCRANHTDTVIQILPWITSFQQHSRPWVGAVGNQQPSTGFFPSAWVSV